MPTSIGSCIWELNVGRMLIFSPRFAVTMMATEPKMNDGVLLNTLDSPAIKTIYQEQPTRIKNYWRKAFAWITNFMN